MDKISMSITFDEYEAYVLTQALKIALIEAESKRSSYEAIKRSFSDTTDPAAAISDICFEQEDFIQTALVLLARIDRAKIIKSDGKH